MAIFLRGEIWWMEYRTRSVRIVRSTGFRRADRAKAAAAYAALRLGMGTRPKRSAMESILSAIYDSGPQAAGIPVSSVWTIYEEWCKGKDRRVSAHTWSNHRGTVQRFAEWCSRHRISDIADVTVAVARSYVAQLGGANKTRRTYAQQLSSAWKAVAQLHAGVHNPWLAATPDNDGSSVRHESFSPDQIRDVLAAARKVGHGWWLASTIAMYTGLRYEDVALLTWEQVDLKRGTIDVIPKKTRHSSGVHLLLPIADPLRKALLSAAAPAKRKGFVLPEQSLRYPKPIAVPYSTVLEKAGLVGRQWGFHSWRHTASTLMAEAGVPVEVRQMICGWTSIAMARHYDHASHLAEMRSALSKMAGRAVRIR